MLNEILYIDPGAGSYLVQVIVAAALGVAFFFRNIRKSISNFWLYIKSFFYRSPRENNK